MAKSDDLLTVPCAAKKTAMSTSWWRAAIRQRKVRFVRIGGRVLIPESTVTDLIKVGLVQDVEHLNGLVCQSWEDKIMEEKELELEGKRLLTIGEAANFLGLSPRSIYNRIGPRSPNPFPVKPKRIGKLVRFDRLDLEKFVDSL